MPFGLWSGVPDVITHAKFCVNRLRGFLAAAHRIWPFPILFRRTLTTVLHYRADCDNNNNINVHATSNVQQNAAVLKQYLTECVLNQRLYGWNLIPGGFPRPVIPRLKPAEHISMKINTQ